MKILVTGGAGFIGSNFIRHVSGAILTGVTNLDTLTYAESLEHLRIHSLSSNNVTNIAHLLGVRWVALP